MTVKKTDKPWASAAVACAVTTNAPSPPPLGSVITLADSDTGEHYNLTRILLNLHFGARLAHAPINPQVAKEIYNHIYNQLTVDDKVQLRLTYGIEEIK